MQPTIHGLSLRAVIDLPAVVDIEDVDNAAVLVDPVDDAIGSAPRRDSRRADRTAACLRAAGSRRALPHRTPAPRRQRLPEASGRSLAARRAGSGSRTVARSRSSRTGNASPRQILAKGGHVSSRLTAAQCRQALRNTRNSLGVAEDLQ